MKSIACFIMSIVPMLCLAADQLPRAAPSGPVVLDAVEARYRCAFTLSSRQARVMSEFLAMSNFRDRAVHHLKPTFDHAIAAGFFDLPSNLRLSDLTVNSYGTNDQELLCLRKRDKNASWEAITWIYNLENKWYRILRYELITMPSGRVVISPYRIASSYIDLETVEDGKLQ